MSSSDRTGAAPAAAETALTDDRESPAGSVVIGLVIMGLGVYLLLSRLDMIDFHLSARVIWPFIVIALGLARMVTPGYRRGHERSRRSGAWLVWVGLWGLVSEFHVFGLDYGTSWPLLVVGVGLGIVWRAFEGQDGRDAAARGRN